MCDLVIHRETAFLHPIQQSPRASHVLTGHPPSASSGCCTTLRCAGGRDPLCKGRGACIRLSKRMHRKSLWTRKFLFVVVSSGRQSTHHREEGNELLEYIRPMHISTKPRSQQCGRTRKKRCRELKPQRWILFENGYHYRRPST